MELAVGTEPNGDAKLGSSYYFTLGIQILSSLSDLSVLISGTGPLSDTTSIHLCSPTITNMQSAQVRQTPHTSSDGH